MAKKIFLIADDADDRALFIEALAEVAPEVICHWATNGRSALAILNSKEIGTPELIFLDVNMPLMNGWQCLGKLKEAEAFKNIPVIMYSTTSYEEEIQRALHAGVLCFFSKPSDFKELQKSLALVVQHLNNHSLSSLVFSPLFIAATNNSV